MTNSSLSVKIKKLHPDAVFPRYAHWGNVGGDSGADLIAVEDTEWLPIIGCDAAKEPITVGYKAIVKTGLQIELPPGYELQVRPRGGNAGKFNISVLNTPGTVDNGYRGEIMVILYCLGIPLGDYANKIPKGAKVAQAVIAKFEQAVFVEEEDLSATKRGTGALNSTQTFLANQKES
jgi:dUTP pyrophosphatase